MGLQKFRQSIIVGSVCIWMLSSSYVVCKSSENCTSRSYWLKSLETVGEAFALLGAIATPLIVCSLADEALDALK